MPRVERAVNPGASSLTVYKYSKADLLSSSSRYVHPTVGVVLRELRACVPGTCR